jgi:ABC-type uncharacterized transport system permease subunit
VLRLHARAQISYRADFVFRLIGLLVTIYLLRLVWEAVYPASHTVTNGRHRITLDTQIAYVSFASVQNWLLNSAGIQLIPQRVREGTIAVDLARPLHFPTQMVWAQAGSVAAHTPFVFVAVPFAVLAGGARAPASALHAVAYVLSLAPALLISLLLTTLVSMVAFWTTEISGILIMYRTVQQFMAGTLVPLWFMPDWLRLSAQWLPFQSTTYAPLAVYLGQADPLPVLGVQLVWCVVLLGALRLVWARALHRVVVQGG